MVTLFSRKSTEKWTKISFFQKFLSYQHINTCFRSWIDSLQAGHNSSCSEHSPQHIKWPHGRNIIPRSRSKQTLHSFSSCMVTRSSSSAKSAASANDLSFGMLCLIAFKIGSFCALTWFALARNSNKRTRSLTCFTAFFLASRISSTPLVSILSSLRIACVNNSSSRRYSRSVLNPWKDLTRFSTSSPTERMISLMISSSAGLFRSVC